MEYITMKRLLFSGLCPLLLALFVVGCIDPHPDQPDQQDAGDYSLTARYTHIRSYPGGGGIFTVSITPDKDFRGTVRLSLQCDALLHASVDMDSLNTRYRVAEITLAPDPAMWVDSCVIMVRAEHGGKTTLLPLRVTMYGWGHAEPGPELELLDNFLTWQRATHPELVIPPAGPWRRYLTYPEHLIVEHWTFLNASWEIRLCRHVMVPPGDWSMLLLRPLRTLSPVLAARRETDGSIHEIPLSEYPIFYGY